MLSVYAKRRILCRLALMASPARKTLIGGYNRASAFPFENMSSEDGYPTTQMSYYFSCYPRLESADSLGFLRFDMVRSERDPA
jgi:hypothetical protein